LFLDSKKWDYEAYWYDLVISIIQHAEENINLKNFSDSHTQGSD